MIQNKENKNDVLNQPADKISENGIGNINIQQMTGADKRIENYERMVGNLFVGQTMTPQKVAVHIGRMPIMNNRNIRK